MSFVCHLYKWQSNYRSEVNKCIISLPFVQIFWKCNNECFIFRMCLPFIQMTNKCFIWDPKVVGSSVVCAHNQQATHDMCWQLLVICWSFIQMTKKRLMYMHALLRRIQLLHWACVSGFIFLQLYVYGRMCMIISY